MANLAVIGTQWGDEGKGKIVDLLGARFDVVARFQGGHNAGHSVCIEGRRYAFHLVPSGILRPGRVCVIGNGVVVEPRAFRKEVEELRGLGVAIDGNLMVSDRAHVIAPWHHAFEREYEQRLQIGTTLRAIGPAYAWKASRVGVRVVDLLRPAALEAKVKDAVERTNRYLGSHDWFQPLDEKACLAELCEGGEYLRPFVVDTSLYLEQRLRGGASVLFEGAQGSLLDVDHGTYPYVTSSSASVGGVLTGLGVGPTDVHGVLGVVKAYATRVGAGPMPTELKDARGELLRQRGNEYGVSTGRPRRCGWLDAVAVKHAVRINGIRLLAITLLDVLDAFDEIRVGVGYRTPAGEEIRDFPADTSLLEEVEVLYEALPGWSRDLTGVRRYEDLPGPARAYVKRLEELFEARVGIISVGTDREQTIVREELLESWPRLEPGEPG